MSESDYCPLSGDRPAEPEDRAAAEVDYYRRLLAEAQARESALQTELARLRLIAERRSALDARFGKRQCPTCGGSGYYPYLGNPHPNGMCDQCDGTGCEIVYLSAGGA